MRTLALALATLVSAPVGAVAQDQVELRGELVEVRAVVTDGNGRPRGDLRKEDFEVRENGRPRDVAFFSVEHVGGRHTATVQSPDTASTPSSVAPAPAVAPATPRSVIFAVDGANMPSGSVSRAKKALCAFVESRASDLGDAAVVSSSGTLGLENRFTRSSAELCGAIDRISPRPATFSTGAFTPYLAAQIVYGSNPEAMAAGTYLVREQEGIPPPMDADVPAGDANAGRLELLARQRAFEVLGEAAEQRRIALATLRAAVERLARAPGQRLLVLVSDGFTLYDRGGERESAELKAVIARAVRSGVVISSLSGAGLESGTFSGADDPLYAVPMPVFAGYATASRRELEDGVTALAKDTGGEVLRNTNDFGASLGRVLDANDVYYVLSFYPEDGDVASARTIDVRLKNRPELSVRAQRGADAPPTDDPTLAATPVVRALGAARPPTELGVSARAEVAGPTGGGMLALLNVYVDGDKLDYRADGDRRGFDLEVATSLVDERGSPVDTKVESLAGKLAPRALDLARASGFHVTRQATLPPGKYRLRVAVRETSSGRIGTASTSLDVPDLAAGRLALGGLVLSAARNGAPTVPRSPKGLRTFAASDALIYTASVFNVDDPSRSRFRIAILRDAAVLYRSAWEPLASRLVDRKDRTVRLSGQLQLGTIPAGAYTLRIEVDDPQRGAAAQTAEFAVVR